MRRPAFQTVIRCFPSCRNRPPHMMIDTVCCNWTIWPIPWKNKTLPAVDQLHCQRRKIYSVLPAFIALPPCCRYGPPAAPAADLATGPPDSDLDSRLCMPHTSPLRWPVSSISFNARLVLSDPPPWSIAAQRILISSSFKIRSRLSCFIAGIERAARISAKGLNSTSSRSTPYCHIPRKAL